MRLAADDALDAHVLHQSLDGASGHVEPFPAHLAPDLAHAVDAPVVLEDTLDLTGAGTEDAQMVVQPVDGATVVLEQQADGWIVQIHDASEEDEIEKFREFLEDIDPEDFARGRDQ